MDLFGESFFVTFPNSENGGDPYLFKHVPFHKKHVYWCLGYFVVEHFGCGLIFSICLIFSSFFFFWGGGGGGGETKGGSEIIAGRKEEEKVSGLKLLPWERLRSRPHVSMHERNEHNGTSFQFGSLPKLPGIYYIRFRINLDWFYYKLVWLLGKCAIDRQKTNSGKSPPMIMKMHEVMKQVSRNPPKIDGEPEYVMGQPAGRPVGQPNLKKRQQYGMLFSSLLGICSLSFERGGGQGNLEIGNGIRDLSACLELSWSGSATSPPSNNSYGYNRTWKNESINM